MRKSFKGEEEFREGKQLIRVKLPKDKQVIGIIIKLLGAARMDVQCVDGRTRRCRVPGRFRRRLWLKESNLVIVEPWDIEGETKGDVIYKYSKTQESWLRRKGYIKKLEEEF